MHRVFLNRLICKWKKGLFKPQKAIFSYSEIIRGNKKAIQELKNNPILKSQAQLLVKLFLEEPTTEFDLIKLPFEVNLLKERGELKEWSANRLKLNGGDSFFALLLPELASKFPIEISKGYDSVKVFLQAVEDYYQRHKPFAGLHSLLYRFEKWLKNF